MIFSESVAHWYANNRRDLPWRHTKDPYRIWLSEVILQQTRVDQGTNYWHKFVAHYPTVNDLAAATEDEVLKDWQGLGYYSRARNLHAAAKMVVAEHDGIFPSSAAALLKLKGVGAYTAAAVASIAYDEPVAVVDGNVYRVLSRVFGMDNPIDEGPGQKAFAALAQELLDRKAPGTHNQAVMEFGALQCVPRNPKCDQCPLEATCEARRSGQIEALPVKARKTKVRDRFFYYFILNHGNSFYIRKRSAKGIWQNLYEFPLQESDQKEALDDIINKAVKEGWYDPKDAVLQKVSPPIKHVLSHQRLHTRFLEITVENLTQAPEDWIKVNRETFSNYAIPRLIDRYLQDAESSAQGELFT